MEVRPPSYLGRGRALGGPAGVAAGVRGGFPRERSATYGRAHMATRPVLVVEDDADTRELLTDALREDGFDVIASDEGRKAIELATVLRPSVVLLDMAMAGMDGRTFLERRRSVPTLARTPVVVISGSDVTGVAADAILRKPLELREVLATVRRLRARGS